MEFLSFFMAICNDSGSVIFFPMMGSITSENYPGCAVDKTTPFELEFVFSLYSFNPKTPTAVCGSIE